jgi:hypothetical protein
VRAAEFVVTTTADAGLGSLRAAIDAANANPGPDDIVFNIPQSDAGFNGTWWTITITSDQLPRLLESGTRILGWTQAMNQGDVNPGTVGSGGTVGTDQIPLPLFERPEVLIDANGFDGLVIAPTASNVVIEGLAVVHARHAIVAEPVTVIGITPGTSRLVRGMFIGVLPDGADPDTRRNTGHGVRLQSSSPGLPPIEIDVDSSLVGYNGQVGVVGEASGSVLRVRYCEVFQNGFASDSHDGIDVNGVDGEVVYTLSRDNGNSSGVPRSGSGSGIELGSQSTPGTGNNLVSNNTVRGNVSAGIVARRGASGNTIVRNVITENAVGVLVHAEGFGTTDANLISQNSIFSNQNLGIDLHAGSAQGAFDGVTLNQPGGAVGGSNRLQPYPLLTGATVSGGALTITGYASAGATIEVFEAETDRSGFGEGFRYLFTVAEGAAADIDATSGSYGPLEQGVEVASDVVAAERFLVTVPLPGGLGDTFRLTATETVERNTSEFSPVISAPDGAYVVDTETESVPDRHALLDVYPNPVSENTSVSLRIGRASDVDVALFDVTGRQIRSLLKERMAPGVYDVRLSVSDLTRGVYLVRATAGVHTETRSIVVVR